MVQPWFKLKILEKTSSHFRIFYIYTNDDKKATVECNLSTKFGVRSSYTLKLFKSMQVVQCFQCFSKNQKIEFGQYEDFPISISSIADQIRRFKF